MGVESSYQGSYLEDHGTSCRNLIKKPLVFTRVLLCGSCYFGMTGPGLLNQVPTFVSKVMRPFIGVISKYASRYLLYNPGY